MEDRVYNPQFYDLQFLKNKSGVYQIRNICNNKIYIGSTMDLKSRCKSHFNSLNRGRHQNKYLQRAYNKYGKQNFIFEIIEFCNPEIRFDIEQYWINQYIGNIICYNINEKASCPPIRTKEQGNSPTFTKEQREHLSKLQKELYEREPERRKQVSERQKGKCVGKDHPNARVVVCLETGKIYLSITEAQLATGIKQTSISCCCCGRSLTANGLHWMFKEDYDKLTRTQIQDIINFVPCKLGKPCVCLETGKVYISLAEAAKQIKCGIASICLVCNHKLKSIKGLRFVYKDEFDKMSKAQINRILQTKIKKLKQPCICLETQKIYNSITDASKCTNIQRSVIQSCCSHKIKMAGGFHWLYQCEYEQLSEESIKAILCGKRKTTGKPCKCLETGQVFESAMQASKIFKLADRQIRNSCKGLKAYTRGYHFEYVE